MSTPNRTNFCPLPFAHATIATNGEYKICCAHVNPPEHSFNIKQISFDQWKKSDYVKEVKDSFSADQQHPGCHDCWNRESIGSRSYRQRITKEYSLFKVDTDYDQLVNVEIQLGNLCNLTCLMCCETESSAVLAENKRLGLSDYNQQEFSWDDAAFDHLNQILKLQPKIINIRGGEPLYNKRLLDILEQLPESTCQKTMLHITTNATVWNDQWQQVLKKFKLVRFMFSIDATEDLYEYIRFPASWEKIQNNIKEIVKLDNVKSLVHCTVQNLNISHLYELIQWSLNQTLWLEFEQLVWPNYLNITNLPHALKEQAIKNLEKCLQISNLPDHQRAFVQNCQTQLTNSLIETENITLWKQCVDYLELKDQLRGNSHKKFLNY